MPSISRAAQPRHTHNYRKRRGVIHRYYLLKQNPLTPEQVKVGTGVVRTYTNWEDLFKSPEVGGVLGIDHLFIEAEE